MDVWPQFKIEQEAEDWERRQNERKQRTETTENAPGSHLH